MDYFIHIAGAARGPFAPQQLPEQGLRPDSLVWAQGMPQWQRADSVPELQPYLATGAPPPPPPFAMPVNYAQAPYPAGKPGDKKLAAGLCGIFLGAFGVHKFVLGYNAAGVIMLVSSLLCIGYPVMHVIGLIEGIMYLAKNDSEFYQQYMLNRREWF